MPLVLEDLKEWILKYVSDFDRKQPSWQIEQYAARYYPAPRKEIKGCIKALVSEGELVYTYEHGCSFLVISFQRAVRVSRRVVLKPPGVKGFGQPGDVEIDLMQGASFGTGQHPTTRLSINGVDAALKMFALLDAGQKTMCLEIGTGSGVLAILADRLGIDSAMGTDIEPSARKEARENVKINGLSRQIEVSDMALEKVTGRFALITANLRYPTLMIMAPCLTERIAPGGRVVISGIYDHEMAPASQKYLENGFTPLWQETEKGWGGIVFEK